MTMEMVRIAAFDLDDTVVGCNSQSLFVRYLTERRLAPASLLMEVGFWFSLNWIGWRLDVPKIHARLISRLSGVERQELQNALREFSAGRLRPLVRADAEQWMARVRAEGCHVLLLSAALEPMVTPIAEAMHVDGHIATRVSVNASGRLAVVGDLIYGEAKVRALREYANARFGSWRLEYAFGNAYDDRFLLGEAVNAMAVCPEPRLRAFADRQGWPRAEWR